MHVPSYIQRNRFGVFVFRRAIPAALRGKLKRREFLRTLGTREPREAIARGRVWAWRIDQWFREMEQSMTSDDKTYIAPYSVTITHPDGTKVTAESSPDDVRAWKEAGLPPEQIAALLAGTSAAGSIAQSRGGVLSEVNATSTVTLDALIARYRQHCIDEHTEKRWTFPSTDDTKLRRLAELAGSETSITLIDANMAEYVRANLKKLPRNAKRFPDMTAQQVISTIAGVKIDLLSPKTINDHLDLYRRVFQYGRQRQLIPLNPFEGVKVANTDKQRAKDARKMFEPADLVKIFSTKIHTNPTPIRPYRYWGPLIALTSGARRAEIASLYLSDVKEIDGVWVLDINELSEDKSVKTANGIRRTPIHRRLIELGLLDYAEHLKALGETRLFPDLVHHTDKEGYGRPLGDWFTEHLKRLGIHITYQVVFYSFRHTTTTLLRRAGVDDMMIEQICGRSDGQRKSVGQQVYTKDDLLPTLSEALHKLKLPELDSVAIFRFLPNRI